MDASTDFHTATDPDGQSYVSLSGTHWLGPIEGLDADTRREHVAELFDTKGIFQIATTPRQVLEDAGCIFETRTDPVSA